jgi:hypothetical protein
VPTTLAGFLVAAFGVLPGFVLATLTERQRARPAGRATAELVLRALLYSLVIQSVPALLGWSGQLAGDLSGKSWREHLDAIAFYFLAIGVVAPTAAGLVLGAWLRSAERRGALNWLHHALGAEDARNAWDYAFQKSGSSFVLVQLREGVVHRSPFLVAKFARQSWAAQGPEAPRDVYFEQVWPADATGRIVGEYAEPRGMWVSADQIDALFFIDVAIDEPDTDAVATPG